MATSRTVRLMVGGQHSKQIGFRGRADWVKLRVSQLKCCVPASGLSFKQDLPSLMRHRTLNQGASREESFTLAACSVTCCIVVCGTVDNTTLTSTTVLPFLVGIPNQGDELKSLATGDWTSIREA